MTEWVELQIYIKFCTKLEHSFPGTISMTQKATAMGNWWLAASSQQYTCWCITSYAGFFGKTSNCPGDSTSLQPRFGAQWLLAFPQSKITFERESLSMKFRKIWRGSWWQLGELCEVSRCLLWRRLRHHSYVQCFLYLVSSSINISTFHITWLGPFWIYLICPYCSKYFFEKGKLDWYL